MFVALCDGERVEADDAKKGLNYVCQLCGTVAILHQGESGRAFHFKHKTKTNCEAGAKESDLHRISKTMLANHFKAAGLFSKMEYRVGNRIADVYVKRASGERWVFEIQDARITPQEIYQRTKDYSEMGLSVQWLAGFDPERMFQKIDTEYGVQNDYEINGKKITVFHFRPKPHELWTHAFNFGEIWFIHHNELYRGKFETHVTPGSTWYDEDGEEQFSYDKFAKIMKTLHLEGPISFGELKARTKFRKEAERKVSGQTMKFPSVDIIKITT
jgi:competence CoiA-like predicted nuclease